MYIVTSENKWGESDLLVTMSTSSEKYETLQDEVDSLLQRIQEDIRKTEAAGGEEKKKLAQVWTNYSSVQNSNNPLFQSCSSMFGEVSSNLDTMDTEARAAPLQFRASMVAQVRERLVMNCSIKIMMSGEAIQSRGVQSADQPEQGEGGEDDQLPGGELRVEAEQQRGVRGRSGD